MQTELTFHDGWSDTQIAGWMVETLAAALAQREGEMAVTVPGGSTPFPIFDAMAERKLDWSRLSFWPGDDRCVPADHPASNFGRLRKALGGTGAKISPLEEDSEPPHFALAWLGMGADGHIASLFPDSDPKADDIRMVRRLTPRPLPPEAPFDRVTLTLPKLLAAEHLVFVIDGAEKKAIFEAAAKGENELPVARLLQNARAPVTCFTR